MAIQILKLVALEKGTYGVIVGFQDENGDDVTPNADTTTWTLTNDTGQIVINSRSDQTIVSANPLTIVLKGNDLLILGTEKIDTVKRRVFVSCEIDSDLGSDLPINDSCEFSLRDLLGQAN